MYLGGRTLGLGEPEASTSRDRLPVLYIIIAVLGAVMMLSLVREGREGRKSKRSIGSRKNRRIRIRGGQNHL